MHITCSGKMTLRWILPTLTLLISRVVCDVAPTVPWLPATPISAPNKATSGYPNSEHSSVFIVSITVASGFSMAAIAIFLISVICVSFKRRRSFATNEHGVNDTRQPDSDMKPNKIYGMTLKNAKASLKPKYEEDCKGDVLSTRQPRTQTFNDVELDGSSVYNVLHHPTDGTSPSAKEQETADYDYVGDDVKSDSVYDSLQHRTDKTSRRNESQTVDYDHLGHTDMRREDVYSVLHYPTNQTRSASADAHTSQALDDYDHLGDTDADVKRESVYNVLRHPTDQTSRVAVYANTPQTLDYDQLDDEVHPFFETGIATNERSHDGAYVSALQTQDCEEVNDKFQPHLEMSAATITMPWTFTAPLTSKPTKITDRYQMKCTIQRPGKTEFEAVANYDNQPVRACVNTSEYVYEQTDDKMQPNSTTCADPMPWIFKLPPNETTDQDEVTLQIQDYDYRYEEMDGKVHLHSKMIAATDPMPWTFKLTPNETTDRDEVTLQIQDYDYRYEEMDGIVQPHLGMIAATDPMPRNLETKPNRITEKLRCAKSPAHIKYEEAVNDYADMNTSPTLNREQANENNAQPHSDISAAIEPILSDLETILSKTQQESDIEYEEVYEDNGVYESTAPQPLNYQQLGGKTKTASVPLADQYTFI